MYILDNLIMLHNISSIWKTIDGRKWRWWKRSFQLNQPRRRTVRGRGKHRSFIFDHFFESKSEIYNFRIYLIIFQISFVRNVDEITQPQCIQIRSNFLSEICLIIAQNQTLSLFLVNLARYVKSYNSNCILLKF